MKFVLVVVDFKTHDFGSVFCEKCLEKLRARLRWYVHVGLEMGNGRGKFVPPKIKSALST